MNDLSAVTLGVPVWLNGGAKQVLWLRNRRASAETKLGLVLGLTLQGGVDGDRNLLHCCRLHKHNHKGMSNTTLHITDIQFKPFSMNITNAMQKNHRSGVFSSGCGGCLAHQQVYRTSTDIFISR